MIKRLVFFLLIVSAMALAGCDSESDSILEDPVNVNVVKHEADEVIPNWKNSSRMWGITMVISLI